MVQFIIRLDDAACNLNIKNWNRIEKILINHDIHPVVGVIPYCNDKNMLQYEYDEAFWETTMKRWIRQGWTIAMHGYDHVFISQSGGINPVNDYSEFAGIDYGIQEEKIRKGVECFQTHGINPSVFFAPAHTYDYNTIKAIKKCSNIKFISDTPAFDSYKRYGITFVPQQSGRVRFLPLKTVTFCYHPNTMTDEDFYTLESFFKKHKKHFVDFPKQECARKFSLLDMIVMKLYYLRRRK